MSAGLLALFSALLAAPADWSELLSSHERDPSLVSSRRRAAELTADGVPQLWDDLELRYEAKRGDLRKQEIGLRLSPAGLGELSASRASLREARSLGDSKLAEKAADALLDRYRLGLRWLRQKRRVEFHQAMADLCRRRVELLAGLSGSADFDAKELVEGQVDRADWLGQVEADRYDLAETEGRIRSILPGSDSVVLDTALLPVSEVERRIASLSGNVDDSFPSLSSARGRLALAEAREREEETSNRRWISYLSVSWTFDQDENSSERGRSLDNLGFGAGIRVPFLDGGSRDLARRRADLAEAQLDFQDERDDLRRELGDLRLEIGALLRQTAVLDSFARRVDAGQLFERFAARTGADPLLLLRARETSLRSAWKIQALRLEILDRYLRILRLSGALDPDANQILAGGDGG